MKLLYITFIDMYDPSGSGSSVRPKKMLDAFKSLGADITLLSGVGNDVPARRSQARLFMGNVKKGDFDCCYIEPPSGPMFCYDDVRLIKKIHDLGVPIGLFYRDAYWKHPEFYMANRPPLIDRLKLKIIQHMQKRQWRVFAECCDIIYFPSNEMAKEFVCERKRALPPGCSMLAQETVQSPHVPLRFIFVGGAAKNYGTFLTLDAFEIVNAETTRCELTYVCPKDQWDKLGLQERAEKNRDWLTVVHTSGDENLKPYYEGSDVALLVAPRTRYRDFAVPIKVFEYMSYLKPMLVTDCKETARIVVDNQVGWVVADDAEAVSKIIIELVEDPHKVESKLANLVLARENNQWEKRAEQVVEDLTDKGVYADEAV